MGRADTRSEFVARLRRPASQPKGERPWAFIALPPDASDLLPRRGRTTVEGRLAGADFVATLEPDGQLGHWLRVDADLMAAAGVNFGDDVEVRIEAVADEPDPAVPEDLLQALQAAPEAWAVWQDTTSLARVDWVHWVVSAKQAKTRAERIRKACDMLASGKRRVCCFDPSGHYSKALSLPAEAE